MKLLTRSEEYVLLAVRKLKGNAYTLSILQELSNMTGYTWQVGAVYVPLEKLWKKGYLTRKKGDPSPERGGRSKFLYNLTRDGIKALQEIRDIQDNAWSGISKITTDEEYEQ
ncbi:MAG: helix-turn-helix transcriptional regulator [Candidatus Aminicenantes bacterium]|nr:helix-turn-helix transcriptional regulator [Candidatus Aminicenantes bacterium]